MYIYTSGFIMFLYIIDVNKTIILYFGLIHKKIQGG